MLVLSALTACSAPATSVSSEGPTTPAATGTASVPGAPAPAPAPTRAKTRFAVGEVAEFAEVSAKFTVVVLAYSQPVEGPQPPDRATLGGDVWATVEVKVCNTEGKTFAVSQFPWSLAYEDGMRIKVTGLNGGDLPKPEFPTVGEAVRQGDCVRGKIPYPVPGDKRPARIVYAPEALQEPLDWVVPAG
ncbi:hypothetical protein Slala03_80500 [Streptomyces lavendulae subsp. lavendulae]|uniref:DUF4352 domain-containing protein n=1 Tax=Streptomyces lavendulae TaxID=1914 RepID=UPI00249FD3F3|nr:DUF4352 domain-containing protein [Streptomyces lavendulae]GLV88361.1 hypothetical protein Slala03_80500 [Streptomyces lavendulae subsp. lavendulae]